MKFKAFAVVALGLAISACSSNSRIYNPNISDMNEQSFGAEISTSRCFTIVERGIRSRMKDPVSTRFNHASCKRGYFYKFTGYSQPKPIYGYVYQGEVNGKNSYGGYVGFKKYYALVKDGRVVELYNRDSNTKFRFRYYQQ